MRRLLLLLFAILCISEAQAQDRRVLQAGSLKSEDFDVTRDNVRHVTLELLSSDEGRAAIEKYSRLRAAGKLPLARKGASFAIGETKMFSVRDLSVETVKYDDIEFTKKAENVLFDIWVQTSELSNGHVRDLDVEAMRKTLAVQTPPDSYDPTRGVLSINTEVFGPSPNVDGDGKLDVLIVDIQDGPDVVVLGFFDPSNLSGRNNADIIYIDSFPGMVNLAGTRNPFGPPEQTLAHEFQHLIFSRENGFGDLSFVNEGLSEWAEVVNGFTARSVSYFQVPVERSHQLLDFRDLGGPSGYDYQRAGLFTNYISERIGVLNTGAVARASWIGAKGYYQVLNPLNVTVQEVITGFHIANILNDRSIAEEYGYANAQYRSIKVSTVPVIDGTTVNSVLPTTGSLSPGGVRYAVWEKVGGIDIQVAEDNGLHELLNPVIVAVPEVGPPEIVQFAAGEEGAFLGGNYLRVTLVIPHVFLWHPSDFSDDNPPSADYTFSATWLDFESGFTREDIVYDNGTVASAGNPPLPLGLLLEQNDMKASRFDVPSGGVLDQVLIDQLYAHNFNGSTVAPNAPRDFTLFVWDEQGGLPGNELFSLDVEDLTASGTSEFIFHTIDLSAFSAQLSALPPVIFIGSGNAGTDENYLGFAVSAHPGGSSPSFIFENASTSWLPFDALCISSCNEISLSDFVLPIRASFITSSGPTAIDVGGELPISVTLEQNYPNPFNPVTTIRFSLPRPGKVTLKVFDLLGRQIETLAQGFMNGGTHEVQFDASSFASGLYIFALETEAETLTRTMTLMK